MIRVTTVKELRAEVAKAKGAGKSVGFVPTMGNLHDGHMSLVDEARGQTDFVVASIFVNPLQFGANEDLDSYPRTLEADEALLQQHGCDLVFFPSVDEMYPIPMNRHSIVTVPEVSQGLCGGKRPGHFDGVSTVVTKLFNMVLADKGFFGEKDFQQLAVIKKMVRDLCIPIEIVGVPTGRAEDGLALSSRNGYLTEDERNKAPALYQSLKQAAGKLASLLDQGENSAFNPKVFDKICTEAQSYLEAAGFKPDYYEICRQEDLKPAQTGDEELVILAAAFLGKARLIDNLKVTLKR